MDPLCVDSDPDLTCHYDADADPYPVPRQSDVNLRSLVYRHSTAPFYASVVSV